MSVPSTTEYLDAASWAYQHDQSPPSGLTLLEARGKPVEKQITADGFFGAALETSAGQVIVSFEGTDLGSLESNPAFVIPQLEADGQIFHGENPAAYTDALRFTQTVLKVAAAQGIAPSDVFVDGHSLGGAEAEYVAAQLNLAGETYGAPGIAQTDIPAGEISRLTNYVERGDPVGNYSGNPNLEGNVLQSDAIVRFGTASYLGSLFAALPLQVAGQLYGTSDIGTATSLAILADAAADHHLLQFYAHDLGITPSIAPPSWMTNLTSSDIETAISSVLGGGPLVLGGPKSEFLDGSAAGDTMLGGAGNDLMRGKGGDDLLDGGPGSDILIGGPGNDVLTGSGGADRFVFGPFAGQDTITDFQVRGPDHDIIALPASEFTGLTQILHHTTMNNGNAEIHFDSGATVTLQNVTKTELKAHPNDFRLA